MRHYWPFSADFFADEKEMSAGQPLAGAMFTIPREVGDAKPMAERLLHQA
jgi:hypothetical protein